METKNKSFFFLAFSIILLTGILGLISFVILYLFTRLSIGRDKESKHGINTGSSRMGGLAIILSSAIGILLKMQFANTSNFLTITSENTLIFVFSTMIGLIGLAEDLSQKIGFKVRLILTFAVIIITFAVFPGYIPVNLPLFSFLGIDEYFFIILFFTVFMVAGFINAGNIADGANGLLSIISLLFFIITYPLNGELLTIAIMISLLSFSLYNIFTGEIFLGDFGSYFLSSFLALSCLYIYSKNNVSVFMFASILIYPCFEIIRSLLIRLINKSSIFHPDNDHLHNYINNFILKSGLDQHTSNSVTGVSIALMSSGPALILFLIGVPPLSNNWLILFLIQIIFFALIFILFFNQKYYKSDKYY